MLRIFVACHDAIWTADNLLAVEVTRALFVPPHSNQETRELTSTRRELPREIVRHNQRIQATLKEGYINLASVISDPGL